MKANYGVLNSTKKSSDFLFIFWRIEDTMNCFWDFLTSITKHNIDYYSYRPIFKKKGARLFEFLNKIGPSLLWAFASRHGADYLTNDFFHNGHPTIGRQYRLKYKWVTMGLQHLLSCKSIFLNQQNHDAHSTYTNALSM